MSHISYHNQQEPIKKNPLRLVQMEKPKKTIKPVPNLKFAVAFGFFYCNPPTNQDHQKKFLQLGPSNIIRTGVAEGAQTWGVGGGGNLKFHLHSSVGGASSRLARTRSEVHFGMAI